MNGSFYSRERPVWAADSRRGAEKNARAGVFPVASPGAVCYNAHQKTGGAGRAAPAAYGKERDFMFRFRNDYSQGAHPRVLEAVAACNLEGNDGYGADPHCARAAGLIRALCAAPDAAVHFFVGGTSANLTAIAAFLRPWECVLAPDTGHINVHEGGAAESTGHKILGLPTPDGKLRPPHGR